MRETLEDLWDADAETYLPCHLDGESINSRTVLSLLALFAGDIPQEHLGPLVEDIGTESRFGAKHPLPTVAMDDPGFSADEMWRGPTWVNTTYLVAEGLERNGLPNEANSLRLRLMDGLEASGGPVEYFNSTTGARSPAATVSFGWSAALYVDLAVREAGTA